MQKSNFLGNSLSPQNMHPSPALRMQQHVQAFRIICTQGMLLWHLSASIHRLYTSGLQNFLYLFEAFDQPRQVRHMHNIILDFRLARNAYAYVPTDRIKTIFGLLSKYRWENGSIYRFVATLSMSESPHSQFSARVSGCENRLGIDCNMASCWYLSIYRV